AYPGCHRGSEPRACRAVRATEAERHVEGVAPAEIAAGILLLEDREFGDSRSPKHAQEGRGLAMLLMDFYGFRVSEKQRAFVKGHPLSSVEQFSRTEYERVVFCVEHISQHHLRKLVQEERRCVGCRAARQFEIGGLE